MMEQKSPLSGIGITSLFVVLISLLLCVFAVLSFSSANADLRLSQKLADNTAAYYKAEVASLHLIADASVSSQGANGQASIAKMMDETGLVYLLVETDRGWELSFSYPVDANRSIEVSALLLDGKASLLSFSLTVPESDVSEFEESPLPVWQGAPSQEP